MVPLRGVGAGVTVMGEGPAVAIAPPDQDMDWHRRLVAGDEAALTEVYGAFAALVTGVAFRVLGDRDLARDVTQEVFVQVWRSPLAYEPDRGSLRAWLALLAHRRAVDWVRREERRRRLPAAAAAATAGGAEQAPAADEIVEKTETVDLVRHGVRNLPESLRVAVELAFYRGLTYRQIAVELGIPEGTAKSRMRAALRRLARCLADEGLGR